MKFYKLGETTVQGYFESNVEVGLFFCVSFYSQNFFGNHQALLF